MPNFGGRFWGCSDPLCPQSEYRRSGPSPKGIDLGGKSKIVWANFENPGNVIYKSDPFGGPQSPNGTPQGGPPGICFWHGPTLSLGGSKVAEEALIKIFFRKFSNFEIAPLRGALTPEPPYPTHMCPLWVPSGGASGSPLTPIETEIFRF